MTSHSKRHARTHTAIHRAATVGLAVVTASTLGAGVASAAPAPATPAPNATNSNAAGVNNAATNVSGSSEQLRTQWNTGALQARDDIINGTQNLDPALRNQITQGVDSFTNSVAPGALQERDAARVAAEKKAAEEKAAAEKAAAEAQAEAARASAARNNPCPATARACVDLANNKTWLQKDGKITYGPVTMNKGKKGEETPRGTFYVTRKVKDEVSREFNNAPMPYAVYFTNNGHAFHQGNTAYPSSGCVRLERPDAIRYYNDLQVGDEVYIW
ncbi:L,D-transpeptidase [Corynebacterium anserum]|uniref:L,D-transpeptidase family protein n=1 Tax=Corynebacterium anserum TaxID=2684406 RepID=A0A7G7YM55_9CORY|nr:L,D-transpeptidase [Corynebacterium anserum]QNH95575.1 L,D-transpeptidase family protein [Corynebacterium anserum]